jgi:hypothetical protein
VRKTGSQEGALWSEILQLLATALAVLAFFPRIDLLIICLVQHLGEGFIVDSVISQPA